MAASVHIAHIHVTCNLTRWNNGYNGIYKKDQIKLKHFEKTVFLNKFYIFFHFLSVFVFITVQKAMYKTRNTGTGNGMRGTRWRGECYIPGNVAQHSEEFIQTFRGISSNIPGNVTKHSGECRQTFRGMSSNIPGNIAKYSGECCQTSGECCETFQGMFSNILRNIVKHSGECRQTFRGM